MALEILNLQRKESIPIELVSNQDFTEVFLLLMLMRQLECVVAHEPCNQTFCFTSQHPFCCDLM